MKNDILDERLRTLTAKEVADDYREKEKNTMIEEGVTLPLGVKMSEELLGGRTFYVMYYQATFMFTFQDAWLYLSLNSVSLESSPKKE